MKKINNFKTLFTLSKYILYATLRNPSALFFGFMFPFIFIIAFGLIGQGDRKFTIAVYQDSSEQSQIIDSLEKIDVLEIKKDMSDQEIEEELKKGGIPTAIKIDESTVPFKVELFTTSADPQSGATVSSIISNVLNAINLNANPQSIEVVELDVQNVEGRKFTQIDFILPGQLAFALLSTGVFNIAFSIITLRRTLVLKRMNASPTPKWVILGAKLVSGMMVAVLQATVIISVGYFLMGFTLINGFTTFLSMLVLSLVGLFTFLAIGLFVSSLGNDEDSVSPIANIVTLPQFILSGSFFPIEAFPEFLQPIAKVMPMTFLNDAMRKVAFEGATLSDVAQNILALIVIGIIIYLITLRIFKWE